MLSSLNKFPKSHKILSIQVDWSIEENWNTIHTKEITTVLSNILKKKNINLLVYYIYRAHVTTRNKKDKAKEKSEIKHLKDVDNNSMELIDDELNDDNRTSEYVTDKSSDDNKILDIISRKVSTKGS